MKLSTPYSQEMSRKCLSSWRLFRAFSIVAALFLALHGAAWLWSVNRLDVLITQQADHLRSQGWRVEIAPVRYGGWPGQARVEVGPAMIAAHGVSVRAESLIAKAALIRPGPLTWHSRRHAVRFGSGPERPVLAGDVVGEASPDGIVLTTAAMHVAGLFAAETLRIWVRPNEAIITMQSLHPLAARWALGPAIDAVDLHIEAESPTSLAASAQLSPPRQAEDDHFAIILTQAAMGGMDATGRAELWFDAGLPPRLNGVVHVAGYAAGLDGLAAAKMIPTTMAVAAKAVLGLLATRPDGTAEVPVRIEGNILYAAQFALLRLSTPEEPDLAPLR